MKVSSMPPRWIAKQLLLSTVGVVMVTALVINTFALASLIVVSAVDSKIGVGPLSSPVSRTLSKAAEASADPAVWWKLLAAQVVLAVCVWAICRRLDRLPADVAE